MAEKFWGFKRFGEIKRVGQVENLIAPTKKKNTVDELDQTPRKNRFRFDQTRYFLNIGLGVINPTFQTN
jgi:hypothetical protein